MDAEKGSESPLWSSERLPVGVNFGTVVVASYLGGDEVKGFETG